MTALRRAIFVLACLWVLSPTAGRASTFLFDATKAETAGNADWVIDEDNHVAGRYPTPAAAGITATTPETYWTGALSAWGVALVQMGHNVEQLPVGGRITYLDSTNAQDLSNYRVYVVCEPNILFTAAEKTAIASFVQNGGSLFVISDHAGSDRNNDGYDSVAIWNDFFSSNGVRSNPFGVTINSTDISLVSSYVDTAADDPLTNGALGAVSLLKYSDGATMTLNPTANATVRAAFWSSATHTASNVMAAWGRFGAGRFAVVCDSSPPDDGTGSSGHTLYPGWTEEGVNHSRLFLNASVWLATGGSGGVPSNDAFANASTLTGASVSATVANVNATKETGEPDHGYNAGGHSVWWRWTAPANGSLTVSTVGSSFDTTLGVYTGTVVNALTTLAEDDDGGGSLTSKATVAVTAGTAYNVAVDGYDSAMGTIAFNLAFTAGVTAPVNDNFAAATVLSGTAASVTGTNVGATAETGEVPPFSGGGHSVWWRWTAPDNLLATVSTAGSNFDTTLAVYTGTAVNALTLVGSNDQYGGNNTSQLSFSAQAGVTYMIYVDGYGANTGSIALGLATQPLPPTVSVTATKPRAAEHGQTPGVFTIGLSPAGSTALTVNFNWAGTAVAGTDYVVSPNVGYAGGPVVTIPAGQTSVTVTITPVDDNDPTEGDETATLTLVGGTGYQVSGSAAAATVTILDDSPYTAAWAATYRAQGFSGAAAAPTADPDADGIPNLLEFAFNLNPLAADGPGALPVLGTGTFADPADAGGSIRHFATLTFTRRTDAPGLTYTVEATSDLAANAWTASTPVFVSANTVGMPANTERAVYRAGSPVDGPNAVSRQCLRVRVSAAFP